MVPYCLESAAKQRRLQGVEMAICGMTAPLVSPLSLDSLVYERCLTEGGQVAPF